MVHFIWGKKDFRLYFGRKPASGSFREPVLYSNVGEVVVTSLQYQYAFEWYEFDKVAGHGLASEEVLFRKNTLRRYVELPKDFYETALEIACIEFDFNRQSGQKAG